MQKAISLRARICSNYSCCEFQPEIFQLQKCFKLHLSLTQNSPTCAGIAVLSSDPAFLRCLSIRGLTTGGPAVNVPNLNQVKQLHLFGAVFQMYSSNVEFAF